jgi:hypothetical protein
MAQPSFAAIKDQVQGLVQPVIESTLSGQVYRRASVKSWSDAILTEILRRLAQAAFPDFKFVVSCLILTTEPNGMYTMTHSLWDRKLDGSLTVEWSSKTMQCLVVVYGVKY